MVSSASEWKLISPTPPVTYGYHAPTLAPVIALNMKSPNRESSSSPVSTVALGAKDPITSHRNGVSRQVKRRRDPNCSFGLIPKRGSNKPVPMNRQPPLETGGVAGCADDIFAASPSAGFQTWIRRSRCRTTARPCAKPVVCACADAMLAAAPSLISNGRFSEAAAINRPPLCEPSDWRLRERYLAPTKAAKRSTYNDSAIHIPLPLLQVT